MVSDVASVNLIKTDRQKNRQTDRPPPHPPPHTHTHSHTEEDNVMSANSIKTDRRTVEKPTQLSKDGRTDRQKSWQTDKQAGK